jgi:hypothetical protein
MAEQRSAARVLDTYAAPGARTFGPTIGGNAWQDLAAGLADFNPALNRFLKQEHDIKASEDEAAGAQLQQEQRVTLKEAVRKGVIPEGANPYLKLGYLKSELRQKGNEFQTFLLQQWQEDGAIQDAEADAIPDWAGKKTADWMKTNLAGYAPELVQQVFDPAAQSGQNRLMQYHIGESFKRTSEKARSALEQEVSSLFPVIELGNPIELASALAAQGHDLGNFQDEAELRRGYLVHSIQTLVDDAVANGMSGSDANLIAAEAVAVQARAMRDLSVLNVLDDVRTNSGPLSGITKVRQLREAAEDNIASLNQRDAHFAVFMREQQQKQQVDNLMRGAWSSLVQDHTADIDEALMALSQVDPGAASSLLAAQSSMIQARTRVITDHRTAATMRAMVHEGSASMRDIVSLVGVAYDSDFASSLMDDLDRAQRYSADLADEEIQGMSRDLERLVSGGDPIAGGLDPALAELGVQAKNRFNSDLLDWVDGFEQKEGRKPRRAEIRAAAEDLQAGLLKNPRYNQQRIGDGATYETPTEAKGDVATPVEQYLPPAMALEREPAKVDWQNRPMWTDADAFMNSVQRFETTGTGLLKNLVDHLSVSPDDLIATQARLLGLELVAEEPVVEPEPAPAPTPEPAPEPAPAAEPEDEDIGLLDQLTDLPADIAAGINRIRDRLIALRAAREQTGRQASELESNLTP